MLDALRRLETVGVLHSIRGARRLVHRGCRRPIPGSSPNGLRGWADHVAFALAQTNPDLRYANLAVRGRRMDEILVEQVQTAVMLEPDLVTIYAGMNNLLLLRNGVDAMMARYAEGLRRCSRRRNGPRVHRRGLGTVPLFRRLRGRAAVYNELLAVSPTTWTPARRLWRFAEFPDARLWDEIGSASRRSATSASPPKSLTRWLSPMGSPPGPLRCCLRSHRCGTFVPTFDGPRHSRRHGSPRGCGVQARRWHRAEVTTLSRFSDADRRRCAPRRRPAPSVRHRRLDGGGGVLAHPSTRCSGHASLSAHLTTAWVRWPPPSRPPTVTRHPVRRSTRTTPGSPVCVPTPTTSTPRCMTAPNPNWGRFGLHPRSRSPAVHQLR